MSNVKISSHLPKNALRANVSKVRMPGNLVATRAKINNRTKPPTVMMSGEKTQPVATPDLTGIATGVSGVSMGLTIPGPQGSYMAARIDVACYLPHGPSDAEAQAAIARSVELVQRQLEEDAKAITAFFG